MNEIRKLKPTVILDLDGTLRDTSKIIHLVTKRPKKYGEFYLACESCPPIPRIVRMVRQYYDNPSWHVVVASGQPETYRANNERWLAENLPGFKVDWMCLRQVGDHRKAPLVKSEMLLRMKAYGYHPIVAWDDDPDVADMYRADGLSVHQVWRPTEVS
jgi:hypothetical protein